MSWITALARTYDNNKSKIGTQYMGESRKILIKRFLNLIAFVKDNKVDLFKHIFKKQLSASYDLDSSQSLNGGHDHIARVYLPVKQKALPEKYRKARTFKLN